MYLMMTLYYSLMSKCHHHYRQGNSTIDSIVIHSVSLLMLLMLLMLMSMVLFP